MMPQQNNNQLFEDIGTAEFIEEEVGDEGPIDVTSENSDELLDDEVSRSEFVPLNDDEYQTGSFDTRASRDELLFTGDLDEALSISKGNLAWALEVTNGVDPKKARDIERISKEMQMPSDTVERNMDLIKESQANRDVIDIITAQDAAGKYLHPKTLQYLKDPLKVKLFKDNAERLARIEQINRLAEQKKQSYVGKLRDSVGSGLLRMGSGIADIAPLIHNMQNIARIIDEGSFDSQVDIMSLTGEDQTPGGQEYIRQTRARLDRVNESREEMFQIARNNPVAKYLREEAEQLLPQEGRQSVIGLAKDGRYADAFAALGIQAVNSISSMTLMVASGRISKAAIPGLTGTGQKVYSLSTIGLVTLNNEFAEEINRGKDRDLAFTAATFKGIAEGLFELPTLNIMDAFRKSMKGEIKRVGATAIARDMAKSMLGEGSSEAATEVAQDLADYLTGEVNALDGTTENAINAFIVGGFSGAGISGAGTSIATITASKRVEALKKKSEEESLDYEQTSEIVSELKQDGVSDEDIKEHLESVLENEKIYLEKEDIDIYFQDDKKGKADFEKKTGIEKQMIDSEDSGVEIEIDKSTFLTEFANTPIEEGLKPNMRNGVDGVSTNQAAASKEELLKFVEENQEPAEVVKKKKPVESPRLKEMRDNLLKSKKFSAEEVDSTLAIIDARANVLSEQFGINKEQYLDTIKIDATTNLVDLGSQKVKDALKQGKRPRAAIIKNRGQNIIHLFETADQSSMIHELGHLFQMEMDDLVKAGIATEQMAKDNQAMLAFVDGKFNTEGKEKVARAFESYLRNGKAPSVELSDAFYNFRKWMVSIYRKIIKLDVTLNKDMESVFDRMLATEEQIKESMDFVRIKKDFSDQIEGSKEDKDNLKELKKRTIRDADERLAAKYMTAFFKAIGGRKVIKARAATEVDRHRLHKMMNTQQGDLALNREMLLNFIPENEVKAIEKKFPKSFKKDGVSIYGVFSEYGYESPNEMIKELTDGTSRVDAIKRRQTELEIEAENEILLEIETRKTIDPATDFNSETSLNFLIAEAHLLRKNLAKNEKSRQVQLSKKAVKEVARDTINKQNVKRAGRYDLYSRTEQKWANKAFELFEQGKIEAALEAKKKQILNHALVLESIKARDTKVKIKDKYKIRKFNKRLDKTEYDFKQKAQEIVSRFGLLSLPPVNSWTNVTIGELSNDLEGTAPDWVDTREDGWQELTLEDYIELDEVIDSVIAVGTSELKAIKLSEIETKDQAVDAMIETMKVQDNFVEANKNAGLLVKTYFKGRETILGWGVKAVFHFDAIDNFIGRKTNRQTIGVGGKLEKAVADSEVRRRLRQGAVFNSASEDMAILASAAERIDKTFQLELKGENFIETLRNKEFGKSFQIEGVEMPADLAELGVGWTGERVVSFVLNMGNDGNYQALRDGYKITDEQIQIVAGLLTAKELKSIQKIWDVIETQKADLEKKHFELYNRKMSTVEATPITITSKSGQNVTLKGGYYPLAYDPRLNESVARREKEQALIDENILNNKNAMMFRSVKPADGFTKSRVPNRALPPKLEVAVFLKHINDVTKFIEQAQTLREIDLVIRDPKFKSMVTKKYGKSVYKELNDWKLSQVEREQVYDYGLNRILNELRSKSTVAILGLNAAVGLKQRLSLFGAIRELGGVDGGFRAFFDGMREVGFRGWTTPTERNEMWQQLIGKSPYMKARAGNMDRELRDSISRLKTDFRKMKIPGTNKEISSKDIKDTMFFWIQMNDRAAVMPLWYAAYNKALKSNPSSDQDAVDFADRIIRQSQPSSLEVDLAKLQRSKNEFIRLGTMFQTWINLYGNRVVETVRARAAGQLSNKDVMEFIFFEMALAQWGAVTISAIWAKGELPEWHEFLTAPAESLLAPVPFLNTALGSFKYNSEFGSTPIFEPPQRLINATKSVSKSIQGDKDWDKTMWDVGLFMDILTGIPAVKLMKDANRTYDNLTRTQAEKNRKERSRAKRERRKERKR